MFHEHFMSGYQHDADPFPRHAIGRFGLLLAVFVSGLLYAAIRPVIAGQEFIAVVEVKLIEFRIEMPTTVPPGQVTFSVTNAGTKEHNFEIEGEGHEKRFDTNLKPGETRNLQVDLQTGVYIIYCPVDDHRERGMQQELKVAEQHSNGIVLQTSPRIVYTLWHGSSWSCVSRQDQPAQGCQPSAL
jgi:hypothetical protein